MSDILQACSYAEVDPEAHWIKLMPEGVFRGHDGRGPYHLDNAEAVIQRSLRQSVDLVIDRDHQTDIAPKGTIVKAAGWLKELEARADGIWGRVEWTVTARQELDHKEYRYLSPVFDWNRATGKVMRLLRASLTNSPNLDMPALASADPSFTPTPQETFQMDKHLLAIAGFLGHAATAKPEDIVTAAQARFTAAETASQEVGQLRAALGADDKATTADVVTMATILKTGTNLDGEPDPSKFVPIAVHTELSNRLSSIENSLCNDRADVAVAAAKKAGKVSPAMEDWAHKYAQKDLHGFQAFVSKAPVLASSDPTVQGTAPAGDSAGNATPAELAICRQLGLNPEDLKDKAV